MTGLFLAPDGAPRCSWSAAAPEFLAYHDTEWGFPIGDDQRLFEKLSLEGFQSGLSWRTILAKRENFRAAFAGCGGTRARIRVRGDASGLYRLAGPVMGRKVRSSLVKDLRGLQRQVSSRMGG